MFLMAAGRLKLKKRINKTAGNDIGKDTGRTENKNRENKNKENNKKNRNIVVVSYSFMIIFVLLIAYIVMFLFQDNMELLNNPRNKAQELFAKYTTRGSILSADGKVLAKTVTDDDGNETRVYPYDNMFAHAVGHFDNGKTGLESEYNIYMLNSGINPVISAVNELKGKKNPGDSLVTTLDTAIQKAAYNALGNHKGAVVALEPDSGEILCMVSKPDFNPNTIKSNWESLIEDEDDNSALLNRAAQGLYPPGSTFKLLTLIEYMRENPGYRDFSYECKGSASIDSYKINCYNKKHHGKEDIIEAFASSCNSAFATVGTKLNVKQFRKLCASFLFNAELPVNYEYKSSVFSLKKSDDTGEVMQTAIGQGKTLVSPLHNAIIISAVANGGYLVTPHLADRMINASGKTVKQFSYKNGNTVLNQDEINFLKKCLLEVTKSGTAYSLSGQKYTVYGKTGTAEFDSSGASHAWYIGYAEMDGKKLAVSIIVENSGTGSDYAVPVAKKIFDEYY